MSQFTPLLYEATMADATASRHPGHGRPVRRRSTATARGVVARRLHRLADAIDDHRLGAALPG